jgi:hypothetical protein
VRRPNQKTGVRLISSLVSRSGTLHFFRTSILPVSFSTSFTATAKGGQIASAENQRQDRHEVTHFLSIYSLLCGPWIRFSRTSRSEKSFTAFSLKQRGKPHNRSSCDPNGMNQHPTPPPRRGREVAGKMSICLAAGAPHCYVGAKNIQPAPAELHNNGLLNPARHPHRRHPARSSGHLADSARAGSPSPRSWTPGTGCGFGRTAGADRWGGTGRSRRRTALERGCRSGPTAQRKCRAAGRQAQLATRLEGGKAAAEKLILLEEARTKLADAFKALSAEALSSNNQAFLHLAKSTLERFQEGARGDLESRQQAIGQLVGPLKEALDKVDVRIHDLERARTGAYARLDEQLKSLLTTQAKLESETSSLLKALRTPTVRGRWGGPAQVVEMAGISPTATSSNRNRRSPRAGCAGHARQATNTKEYRHRKGPIASYLEALEAADENEKRARLKDRPADPLTTCRKTLRPRATGPSSSPPKNAQAISDLGRHSANASPSWPVTYRRQQGARPSGRSYNKAVASLETRVLVTARKFRELGAAPTEKELESPELVDKAARAAELLLDESGRQ